MSTHCRIGQVQEDGTIKGVYCHFDGGPDAVGQRLVDWIYGQPAWRREEIVNRLLAEPVGFSGLTGGDIDLPFVLEGEQVEFNKSRIRTLHPGDGDENHTFASPEELYNGVTWAYLFNADRTIITVYHGWHSGLVGSFGLEKLFDLQREIEKLDPPESMPTVSVPTSDKVIVIWHDNRRLRVTASLIARTSRAHELRIDSAAEARALAGKLTALADEWEGGK